MTKRNQIIAGAAGIAVLCLAGAFFIGRGKSTESEETETAIAKVEKTEAAIPETLPDSIEMGTADLIDYESAAIETERPADPTDKDIEARIENERLWSAKEAEGRGIEDGDLISISYVGSVGGVEINDGEAEEYEFVFGDAGTIRQEFADALTGAAAGETVEAVVTYPSDFGVEELNGNTVTYAITVTSVKEVPELDETFIAENTETGSATLEEYQEEIRARLEKEAEESTRFSAAYELLSQLLEDSDYTFTDEFLASVYADYDNAFQKWLTEHAMTEEEYYETYNTSKEAMEEQREKSVQENAKVLLAAKKIQEEKGLVMNNDAIRTYWKHAYGSTITDEEIAEYFPGTDLLPMQATAVLMNYLIDHVTVLYTEPETETEAVS